MPTSENDLKLWLSHVQRDWRDDKCVSYITDNGKRENIVKFLEDVKLRIQAIGDVQRVVAALPSIGWLLENLLCLQRLNVSIA